MNQNVKNVHIFVLSAYVRSSLFFFLMPLKLANDNDIRENFDYFYPCSLNDLLLLLLFHHPKNQSRASYSTLMDKEGFNITYHYILTEYYFWYVIQIRKLASLNLENK